MPFHHLHPLSHLPALWRRSVLTLAACTAPAAAWAQPASYPAQPVKLVVGFAAGGPSDIVARAFADHAAKALSQTVIVENRPGANAVIATEAVAAAKPDGLTLLAAATNHTMIPALYGGRIKFDAARSFVPVGTPPEAQRVLAREAGDFARAAAVRERLATAGLEPQGLCGDAFGAQILREIDANTRIARELNLKAE